MPTVRGSCQCITPLHLPSLCPFAVSTEAQKKLVISYFAKISICVISEMCFFIQHFQTDAFGNPQLLFLPCLNALVSDKERERRICCVCGC